MFQRRTPRTEVGDRRADPRIASDAHVMLRIEGASIAGTAANVSDTGLLFFSLDCPRVEVEVVESGHSRRLHGRLVRMQTMRGNSTGYAVQFDPCSEVSEHHAGKQPK
jgi:hypothetical protein